MLEYEKHDAGEKEAVLFVSAPKFDKQAWMREYMREYRRGIRRRKSAKSTPPQPIKGDEK